MATHRPGFTRKDTDNLSNNGVGASSKTIELQNLDEKNGNIISELPDYKDDVFARRGSLVNEDEVTKGGVETATDLVTKVLEVEDDPSLPVWTFRTIFLGCGLSVFGSVLAEIFYFKPQTIFVSIVFLTVVAYILGDFLAFVIPRNVNFRLGGMHITDGGWGKFFNPGPFNLKEHASITIMSSAAAASALATEALAAQELYYGGYPSKGAGIFIVLSSQLMGFGVTGVLREILVHPTKMVWPIILPVANLLQTIHADRKETKRKLKIWYIVFFSVFFWEILPEWIFPLLINFSIFCLADQHNLVFTNLFGGSTGNEGLGFLGLGFDWNYIAPFFSPFWYPLQTTVNMTIGIGLCYLLFMTVYYGDIWQAKSLPFMSQSLFNISASNSTYYQVYNQSLILNDKFEIDYDALKVQGIPYLTATNVVYLLTTNMGLTATIVYMLLWNWDDLKAAWSWAHPKNLRRIVSMETYMFWKNQETPEERLRRKENDPNLDPHYKLMLRNGYKEVPLWWWGAVIVACWITGIVCLYVMKSTLPWWGFILATIFTFLFVLFFGAQMGITGFQFNQQPVAQMIAGYIFPGRPLANFYFTCFTFNCTQQAQLLAKDLRLAQYAHIPPRSTFVLQITGAVIGALMNWVMMITIVQNQREVLQSIQGSSIWSGQNIQIFNSQAITWSIAPHEFSIGAQYEWVTIALLVGFIVPLPTYIMYRLTKNKKWGYINPSIILWFCGNLYVGINGGFLTFWIIAYTFQLYVRKKHPDFFIRWNYLLSAAFDGGAQIMVFILTFAVAGGSGTAHPFPHWAGNPDPASGHNPDYCAINPGNFGY